MPMQGAFWGCLCPVCGVVALKTAKASGISLSFLGDSYLHTLNGSLLTCCTRQQARKILGQKPRMQPGSRNPLTGPWGELMLTNGLPAKH